MQVHIWPSRTRSVAAAKAAISDHASWVASSVGTGTVWKWSYTQTDSQGPASAAWAKSRMVVHCSAVSMPARSSRQPCGTNNPNRMPHPMNRPFPACPGGQPSVIGAVEVPRQRATRQRGPLGRADTGRVQDGRQVKPLDRVPERLSRRTAAGPADRLQGGFVVVASRRRSPGAASADRLHVIPDDLGRLSAGRGEQQHRDHPGPVAPAHAVEQDAAGPRGHQRRQGGP